MLIRRCDNHVTIYTNIESCTNEVIKCKSILSELKIFKFK